MRGLGSHRRWPPSRLVNFSVAPTRNSFCFWFSCVDSLQPSAKRWSPVTCKSRLRSLSLTWKINNIILITLKVSKGYSFWCLFDTSLFSLLSEDFILFIVSRLKYFEIILHMKMTHNNINFSEIFSQFIIFN